MITTIDEVRESFEGNSFFNHMRFEILAFEEGSVKIKLVVKDDFLNANGTLHGGVHATMLDLIQGMLLRSVTKTKCATISLNTHYLAAVSAGEVFAEARIIHLGYKIATLEAELTDSSGKIIAKAMGTFKLMRE